MELQNQISSALLKKRKREKIEDVRGPYYRDTTAIIHSSPFRRLKHKTQVFFAPSNDHICTRMEHCLHVSSIASTICKGLGLDSEIAWAIGMGHDLGHTPFGHTGEKILSAKMQKAGFPAFEHEVNSLRVVDFLTAHGKGLNLTYAVRDGIACHNGEQLVQSIKPTFVVRELEQIISRKGLVPATYEGVVVRFSDTIAYLGRDFEDACRLGIISEEQLPEQVTRILGRRNADIIDTLVNDIIEHSNESAGISFSDEIFPSVQEMIKFNYQSIYKSPMLEGYERYFTRLLTLILDYLTFLLETYGYREELYVQEKNMLAMGFYHHLMDMHEEYEQRDGNVGRLIYDYVAGMSDNFCLDCANEILKPEHLNDSIEHSLTGKWFDAR
ncbi:deoxyguanosinetriphosphate triphosphohydrolase family protein [Sphaerochaeta halotolerans]|jgi:dGTPase|uniref:HD domain-containing protein n=1 Tax=Sphaerochaeta halotolerans TaxID=2293840 RepID=A0A372MEJ0_9SPIR|nr:HD domain-containing protein [Sphaerochaeta halotolerans]MDN5332913.1 dGTPase [Sphaerochaeta sp.]MXI87456.1 HD domain-containing protein [Sphaerochaeta halotolerans]RFU94164.1 HD domain-containing protein [Sphaerochaeta halotolerans]